jgi:hypothetical protein
MGVIRKTASISTLGLVNYRSKKELLKRAEKDRDSAQTELAQAKLARDVLDERVSATEKRAHRAELKALQQAKKADGAKRKQRRRARKSGINLDAVEEQAKELSRRGRRAAAKAAKQAEVAAAKAQKSASKQGRRAKKKLDEVTEAATGLVSDRG